MGNVDIDLTEPLFSGTYPGNKISNVTPNMTITKDPTITLASGSENAYVRAKVEYKLDGYEMDSDKAKELEKTMNIPSTLWVKSGNYFYCQGVLKDLPSENQVVLFDKVTIPASWGNEVANKTLEINVTAQAIQADNFTPETDAYGRIIGWGPEATPLNK